MSLKLCVFEIYRNQEGNQTMSLRGVLNQCTFADYIEKLNDAGSFKLRLGFTDSNRSLCRTDYIVWLDNDVCGVIEKVLVDPSKSSITVTGRMMTCLLSRRVLKKSLDYSEIPEDVGQVLLDSYTSATKDNPLFITSVDIPTFLGIPFSKSLTPSDLLSTFNTLCASDNLGFRVSFDSQTTSFTLRVFKGVDRTLNNSAGNEPVIMSQDNGCVESATYEQSIKDQPNTAVVQGEGDVRLFVYKDGIIRSEFSTQEVYLDYSLEPKGDMSDEEYIAHLEEKAQEYFKGQKDENTYDAKVTANTYLYMQDYSLGDFVTTWDKILDVRENYQITQVTKSFDITGEKIEPILGVPQKDLVSILQDLNRRVKSSEKKSSSEGSSGGTYYAGQGLTLTADNAFKLNIANQGDIGGLRIAGAESVSDGDVTADLGVYKTPEAFPALRTALRHQKGGFFLGDGFVPVLEEYEDNGETKYRVTDYVQLRLGDGLCFTDNDEEATDVKELRENSLGGRRLSAVKATKELFGTVRPGYGLLIDSEGNLRTIYTSGNGIDISATGEIAVKYDNKTIKLNENEELEASGGLTVENGIIIQESDAEYLLHKYTEVEYIAGNRIGYAGAQNQIITQGYIAYNADKVAKTQTAEKPDLQFYSDLVFEKPVFLCYNTSSIYSISRIYLRFKTATTTYNQYEIVYVTTEGTELVAQSINAYFNYVESTAALGLTWTAINPPGYTTPNGNQYCEFGCAHITPVIVYSRSNATTPYVVSNLNSAVYFPYIQFASEAEYNAAVGLTYEPNTLTQVNETTTIV